MLLWHELVTSGCCYGTGKLSWSWQECLRQQDQWGCFRHLFPVLANLLAWRPVLLASYLNYRGKIGHETTKRLSNRLPECLTYSSLPYVVTASTTSHNVSINHTCPLTNQLARESDVTKQKPRLSVGRIASFGGSFCSPGTRTSRPIEPKFSERGGHFSQMGHGE